jgi:hypothetical protein
MFRVTLTSYPGNGKEVRFGEVCPNANEVRRYLLGRVAHVPDVADIGNNQYDTTTKPSMGRSVPVRVVVEWLPRSGG